MGLDLQGRQHKIGVPSEFAAAALRIVKAARAFCPTLAFIRPDVGVVNW